MSRAAVQRPPLPAPAPAPDGIGAWLDRLLRLTRLPPRHAAEIRDELDAHLRERVRDLMLAGHDEPEAIHKAISELGDLALLAHRYREASRTPKRRLVMNIVIVAAASTALGLSTLSLRQSAPPAGPAPEEQGAQSPDARIPLLASAPLLNRFHSSAERAQTPIAGDVDEGLLEDVLRLLAASQDARPYIHWRELSVSPEDALDGLPLEGQSLDRAFQMVNDALALQDASRLTFRLESGLMEVATLEFFDRRERELVTYDVSPLLNADWPLEVTEEAEALIQLITGIIEPYAWPEAGGESATIHAAGDKLFVSAPPRIHEGVAWVIRQLADDGEVHGGGREEALRNFLQSMMLSQDPGPSTATIASLLQAAELAPAAQDRVVQATVRHAIESMIGPWHFVLSHADSAELALIVRGAIEPMGGSAVADPARNAVVVTGGRRIHDTAAAILSALDRPADAQALPAAPAGGAATPPGAARSGV